MRIGKRTLFRTTAGLLLVLALELLTTLAIPVLNTILDEPIRRVHEVLHEQSAMIGQMLDSDLVQLHEIHPVLGWRYAPNYDKAPHTLNAAGLRSARHYAPVPPPGILRVGAFGDSFVYGSEVPNESAWPALLENDPALEVLNFGVPGYGSDQAFLRYEAEGANHSAHMVLLGFPPTDLTRVVNVYRRFYSTREPPLFKPRFVLSANGALVLKHAPLRSRADYRALLAEPRRVIELGRDDHWFRPLVYRNPLYDHSAIVRLMSTVANRVAGRVSRERLVRDGVFARETEAFRIQLALFERFVETAESRGAEPLIVFFPDRTVLRALREHRQPVYEPLMQELTRKGIDFVDGANAFGRLDADTDLDGWFAKGGHYSVRGNRAVARWLGPLLLARSATTNTRVAAARSMHD